VTSTVAALVQYHFHELFLFLSEKSAAMSC